MFEFLTDSDDSETLTSSQSSMSSDSCSSFSALSFEALEIPHHQSSSSKSPSPSPEDSTLKPHRSSDSGWKAIRSAIFRRKNSLNFRDFKIVKKIGSGDIGNVFLCHLKGSEEDNTTTNNTNNTNSNNSFYAMKVVDKDALAVKKKVERAETEKRILKMLDHPFLPTLYAEFEASHFSCVVMEFCSGGDLHTLRHKQPGKRFSLSSTRFYAAEVLVALEYLHMLGIIYRDLKPENILVRSDGHIMLSDFDLSLCSDAIPAVESPDTTTADPSSSSTPAMPSSPLPLPLPSTSSTPPSPLFSCFGGNRLFRSKKVRTVTTAMLMSTRQFVAEPVTARSCSFVGTHEYVSPEVAGGNSHGNAVDWWAFGIFIYELLYGRTPFAGETNEATLRNIVKTELVFPAGYPASASELQARDLISGLLDKDPEKRLGSKRGAAEVKTHPFFKGLNFALVRSIAPPGFQNLRLNQDGNKKKKTTSSSSSSFDYF